MNYNICEGSLPALISSHGHVATFLVDDVLDVVVVAVERAGVVGHDAAPQHPLGLGHGVAWTREPGSAQHHQQYISISFSIIF